MLKRSFIRCLWGIYDAEGRRYYQRRAKLDNDIKLVLENKFQVPFRTYVFGEDNFKYLQDKGFDVKLVDKNPIAWDMDTQQFRHKLEAFKLGMEEFDEVVFLDWDCIPIKEVPDNFWEKMSEKEKFQAILISYKRKKALWREEEPRKVPCASFVYINDKQIPVDLINIWEEMGRPWSEEVVLAKYTDNLSNGWQGVDYYINRFEPDFFLLKATQAHILDKLTWKNQVFEHFNSKAVDHILSKKDINK